MTVKTNIYINYLIFGLDSKQFTLIGMIHLSIGSTNKSGKPLADNFRYEITSLNIESHYLYI